MKEKSGILGPYTDALIALKQLGENAIDEELFTADDVRYELTSRSDRKRIANELHAQGKSTREIAKLTGWSQSSIMRDIGEPNGSEDEPNGSTTIAAKLQAKDDTRKAVLQKKVKIDTRLHVGDFRKLAHAIPDESVELVFTDPPYDRGSIPLYGAAALEAARILKPGGSMICYCGHVILPHVLPQMIQQLKYYWIGAVVHDGGPLSRMDRYGIIVGFKPLLWFIKQDDSRGDKQNFICDTVLVKQEKNTHPWQQAIATAEHFIKGLTSENGVVVDFFAGGGTTIVAANNLNRQWAAFETDQDAASAIMERLNGV